MLQAGKWSPEMFTFYIYLFSILKQYFVFLHIFENISREYFYTVMLYIDLIVKFLYYSASTTIPGFDIQ